MKVLILHDQPGDSPRADEADAMTQVQAVRQALEQLGHEWMTLGITLDLDAARTALEQLQPDVVFNLCESLGGSARLLHIPCDLLDSLHIPFTGAPALGQLLTTNKISAKKMLRFGNLPTAPWYASDDLAHIDRHFKPGQYIIKSVWEHASIGLDEHSIVATNSPVQLQQAIEQRIEQLGGVAFAEAFVEGREFNLALLGTGDQRNPQMLPPAELVFQNYPAGKPKIVSYSAKWHEDSFEFANTERIYDFPAADQSLIERLASLSLQSWHLFDLRGYVRVDFRVDENGQPWILEVNTNPCLSPDAGFAAALERAGITFAAAIERILNDALPQSAPHATSAFSVHR